MSNRVHTTPSGGKLRKSKRADGQYDVEYKAAGSDQWRKLKEGVSEEKASTAVLYALDEM